MQIFVKLPSGKTITLDVEASDTIAMVKDKIQDKEGIAINKQSLTFNGNKVKDNKTLAEVTIAEGSELVLV